MTSEISLVISSWLSCNGLHQSRTRQSCLCPDTGTGEGSELPAVRHDAARRHSLYPRQAAPRAATLHGFSYLATISTCAPRSRKGTVALSPMFPPKPPVSAHSAAEPAGSRHVERQPLARPMPSAGIQTRRKGVLHSARPPGSALPARRRPSCHRCARKPWRIASRYPPGIRRRTRRTRSA